jgi:hypothetical protein
MSRSPGAICENAIRGPSPALTGPTRTKHGEATCGRANLDSGEQLCPHRVLDAARLHTVTMTRMLTVACAVAAVSGIAEADPSALCYGWKLYPSKAALYAAAKAETEAVTACAKQLAAGRGISAVEPAMDYCIVEYRRAHSLPTSREHGECDPK